MTIAYPYYGDDALDGPKYKWLQEFRAKDQTNFSSIELDLDDRQLQDMERLAILEGMTFNEWANYSLHLMVTRDENS